MYHTTPVTWLSPMRVDSGAATVEYTIQQPYENDYSSKSSLTTAEKRLGGEDEEMGVLRELLAAFPGFSLEVIAAAYTESDSDVNLAAEILATRTPVVSSIHGAGIEAQRSSIPDRRQNECVKQSGEKAGAGSDGFLLQKYGTGVGQLTCRDPEYVEGNYTYINSGKQSMETHSYEPNLNYELHSRLHIGGRSSQGDSESASHEVADEVVVIIGKKRKKKKKMDGVVIEEVEPKDAASRRAVEEFMLSMLGEEFHLGTDVVRDVLELRELEVHERFATKDPMSVVGSQGTCFKGGEGMHVSSSYTIVSRTALMRVILKRCEELDVEGLGVLALERYERTSTELVFTPDIWHVLTCKGRLSIVTSSIDSYFQSLEMLLQMASSMSGLGLNSDNGGERLKNGISHLDIKEPSVRVDPLQLLMGAFPDIDPALVVIAFQEHNGDLEKVSNALLRAGDLIGSNSHKEAITKEERDQGHLGVRLLLDQLKGLFPAVDNNLLFEVLQSTNFDPRDAEQVLLDAGLSPASELPERPTVPPEENCSNFSHSILNKSIPTGVEPPQASLADVKHLSEHSWAVVASKGILSDNRDVKLCNAMLRFKSYGDFDDYGHHRECANEHWRTMQYYFREAAAAYGRGDRRSAGVLSDKGKKYKKLAREADERASQRIFSSRNKDIENNVTIDLHAQHANEAIKVLKLHLRSLTCISSVHTLTIITGYGSHSSNGRARIKPAAANNEVEFVLNLSHATEFTNSKVTKFLLKRGIPWSESNVGCLVVKLMDARNKPLDLSEYESE